MLKKIIALIERKSAIIFHSAVLFFLIAGLIYSLQLGNNLRFPDENEYFILSKNISTGNGYTLDGTKPTAKRTPGYPILLSFFMRFGATPEVLRYINFIALTICLYVSRSILRSENMESGSAIVSLLLIEYGVIFYTAGTLYPQTFCALFILFLVRLSIGTYFSYWHALAYGGCSAFLIMLHPTTIFIPPLISFWMLYVNKRHIISKVLFSALIVTVFFSIWVYWNYDKFGAFIPLSSHGGTVLYLGNNPNTKVTEWFNSVSKEVGHQANLLGELDRDSFYKKKVIKFWKENPLKAIKFYFLKLLNHFNFQNKFYVKSEFNKIKSMFMFLTYYPLLICLFIRLFFIYKIPLSRLEVLFILIYFVSALFHALFVTRIRYRLPYDVILITHIGVMFSILSKKVKLSE